MSTNVGEIDLSLVLNSDKFSSQLKNIDSQAQKASSRITSSLMKIGKAVAIAFSVKKIADFGKECLRVASETGNAWIGLNSILTGQGKDFQEAKRFINEYVSDGLVPLNNAVAAYKNLTLRGYTTDQIQKTMTALKNSATFARQSTYSLGDAVQTATEGLKNENSVVVDNAGVTKNVAKMWEDYARSIGTTRDKLTQAQKIQAEVNGILEETKFQSNDAALYANTYAGKIAQLNTAFVNMKNAIGNAIQPIAKLFIPIITNAVNAVTKLFTAISGLLSFFGLKADSVETVSSSIGDLAGSANNASNAVGGIGNSAAKSAKQIKKFLAGFDEMNKLEEEKDSSSGSGGSGGGGGGGTSTLSTTSTPTQGTSVIEDTVNKFQEIFKKINFKPLIDAFEDLKSAAKPIIETVGKVLKWFYDRILVPFAKWTIEDFLPAFFKALAGVLRLLNPILKAFLKAAEWLWDVFLEPIAKWTGGIIVKVLNAIGEGFSKLGNSISKSKTAMAILEGLAKAVLAMGTAWAIVKVEMKAGLIIQNAIVPIITAMTTAYKVATGQIILLGTATTGTSALVSAFGVITQLLTGKITLATAATSLWSIAQTAFNAVLAANPIGVTIVAITALVAATAAIISWTNKATDAEKEAAEAAKQRLEATNEKYDAYQRFNEQQKSSLDSDMVEINNAQRLYAELQTLADEKGNVADKDKARAEFILGELNKALDTEYTMVGNQISQYSQLKSTIDQVIQTKKVEILLGVEEEKYKEALIHLTETETERTKAKQEMEEALAAFEARENKENAQRFLDAKERYDKLDEMSKTYNENIRIYESATEEMLKGNNKEAIQLLQDRKRELKAYEDTLDLSADEQNRILQDQYTKSLEDLENYTNKYLEGVQGFTRDGLMEAFEYSQKARMEYEKVGTETVDGYIAGINKEKASMYENLKKCFSKATETAKEELDSHSPSRKFKVIGQDTIQGYIDGANGKQGGLISAMRNLFNGAVQTAKKVLDSHSPSKVFEGIGEDTTDGYINGIENNSKGVLKEMDNMFSSVVDTANKDIKFNSNISGFETQLEKGITVLERFKNTLIEVSNVAKEGFNLALPQLQQSQILKANTPEALMANSNYSKNNTGSEILSLIKEIGKFNNQSNMNNQDGDIIIPIYIDGELALRQMQKRSDRLALATNGRRS